MTTKADVREHAASAGRAPVPTFAPQQALLLQVPVTAAVIAVSIGLLLFTIVIGTRSLWPRIGPAATTPLLIFALGILLAHGSLVGIWWARSSWPSHLKTLLAAGAAAGLWGLIIFVLSTAEFRSPAGAGWAASLGTQVVSTVLLTLLVEIIATPAVLERRHRFSIFFLLLWTTVIAVLLGVGRRVAERLGWSAEMLLGWEYFLQLQTMAAINAVLAISLLATLELLPKWRLRILSAAALVPVISVLAPLVMQWMFKNVGAGYFEIVGLLVVESSALLAALVPLQLARGSKTPGPGLVPAGGNPDFTS